MVFNGLSLVVIMWFTDSEKAKATSIIGFGAQCGSLVGMAIPGIVAVGLDTADPKADLLTIRECILVSNVILTFFCMLFLIFFRHKPLNPPSKMAVEADNIKAVSDRDNSASWGFLLKKLC